MLHCTQEVCSWTFYFHFYSPEYCFTKALPEYCFTKALRQNVKLCNYCTGVDLNSSLNTDYVKKYRQRSSQ